MMRIYVAGPMSGLPYLNFPAFHLEAARLREMGRTVINPAEINHEDLAAVAMMTPEQLRGHWLDCMHTDIAALLTCNTICLLPGWEESRGACLEHRIALDLEYHVMLAGWTA